MQISNHKTAIVIGAGIVGLSTARALALKGYQVTIFERSNMAVGASIRNFGMIWPIGQPDGVLLNRAMRSKSIWKEVATETKTWFDECGSLHLAYHIDEMQVLNELESAFRAQGRTVSLLTPEAIIRKYNGIQTKGLLGGLYSESEMIVNSVDAIPDIARYLQEQLNVTILWGTVITHIEKGIAHNGNKKYKADLIYVCSGTDFETLFPVEFSSIKITKCKLQMMRFKSDVPNWRINTAVCGGLSLIHYNSFKVANSLASLKYRYETEMSEYTKNGIHVMVSQNNLGELIVGDTHEYGLTFDPFDRVELNQFITGYLSTFVNISSWKLIKTWNGIYPKMTNGETELILNPLENVYIINGVGGAGMTLSFGLTEEIVNKTC